MGWTITLTLNKDISKDILRDLLSEMPKEFTKGFGEQFWGWSLAVDVRLLECRKNEIKIQLSGSYGMSGKIAIPFKLELEKILAKNGYQYKSSELE